MIIKVKIKGIETEITIPDSKYWIERNKQRITPYWDKADNLEARMTKEFTATFKELEKELYTFAGKQGTDGILTYSQNRIVALMREVKPHIDNLYAEHQESLTSLLMDVYKDNYFKCLYDLSAGTKIYGSFVGINETAIKTAISYPWKGVNFSDQIWQDKNYLIFNLKNTITNGIIRGDSIKDMSKSLMYKQFNAKTGKTMYKGPLGKAMESAQRLVQTEVGNVLTMSDKRAYEEYDMEEYEYEATFDNRTSTICKDLDGQVFKVSDMTIGMNAPSMHVFCRSTTVPYFDDATGKRLVKGLDGGKYEYIDSKINYREWESSYID